MENQIKTETVLPEGESCAGEAITRPDVYSQAGLGERAQMIQFMSQVNHACCVSSRAALLDGFLELTMAYTGGEAVLFLSTSGDEMVVEAAHGDIESSHLVGLHIKRQDGLLGMAGNSPQPVIAGSLPSDPRWLRVASPQFAAHVLNLISLPLVEDSETTGLLQIYNYQQADLDLLLLLAERLAFELKRFARLSDVEYSNLRLQSLVEALGKVTGTLDRSRLLHLIMENASRLVDAERISLFLVDPSTREAMMHVSYQSPEENQTANQVLPGRATGFGPVWSGSLHPATRSPGDFSYVTRSAVTVPITSEPTGTNSFGLPSVFCNDHPHALGGLMAFNKRSGDFHEDDAWLLETLAHQGSTFLQVVELYESTEELFLDAIRALVAAIDAKDSYTQGHSQRVSDYSVMIAQELGMAETQINDLRIASLLHDVGKIGVPDAILKKTGQLTLEEMTIMKQHPVMGLNILSKVKMLENIMPGIVEHHERLDGTGYPHGLRGSQISLLSRIIAVSDVFDAMTSDRPYRPSMLVPDVMAYLKQRRGTSFDPDCVDCLARIIERAEKL